MSEENEMRDMMDIFLEELHKAEQLAFEKGIEANAVILNSEFDYINAFYSKLQDGRYASYPPRIAGKKILKGKLPNKYQFILTKCDIESLEEKLEKQMQINKTLTRKIDILKQMLEGRIYNIQ